MVLKEEMKIKVIKRDGELVAFDESKIKDAINGALIETKEFIDDSKANQLKTIIKRDIGLVTKESNEEGMEDISIIEIEDIQNIVEEALLVVGLKETHKAYSDYRRNRKLRRERFMDDSHMKQYLKKLENIGVSRAVDSDDKRENANVDGDSPMGIMLQFGGASSEAIAKTHLLDPEHSKAHEDGDIHIHDLDFYATGTTTCLQIDLDRLFKEGFNTGHGHLRQPQSIGTAAQLAAIAIQSNQNDQHGGQSIPMFDYYMAGGVLKSFKKIYAETIKDTHVINPVISEDELEAALEKIKDLEDLEMVNIHNSEYDEQVFNLVVKKTEKATYQAMEGFVHNMNTLHSRAGAQVPFSSINFGTDTSKAGRMVTQKYLEALESGLGNHETPIFPISIFKVKDGVNYQEEDPNRDLFDLACRVTAKRMFPNFAFLDAPFNLEYYEEGKPETEATYMGCRTRVVADVTDPEDQRVTGRGNLSFTTINLPRLGLDYGLLDETTKTGEFNREGFFNRLKEELDLVRDQLLERFKYQTGRDVVNFPFLLGQGNWKNSEKLMPGDDLEEVLKHGTLSVGFIGLAECLTALIGEHHGESEKAQELGLEIIGFMRDTVDQYSKDYGLNFTLIATPAEGLSGRFVNIDRRKYGSINGVTDKNYYTNSFHIPVSYSIRAKDKIEKEAPYHALTNAGHISYVELDGDLTVNQKALKNVIDMMKEAGIGYGAINHPLDRDPVCGFSGVIGDICPGCNRREDDGVPFERIRRITGYLVGSLDRFNDAKRSEESDRVKHNKK